MCLRRLIRRALYMADSLGIEDDLLSDLAVEVRGGMGAWYPELIEHAALVANVLDQEEHRFRRTLSTGRSLLEGRIAALDSGAISGRDAFELYDTYGLPFEVTAEVARENDALSDEAAVRAEFEVALEEQRERSRQQATFAYDEAAAGYAELETATEFAGYETVETEAEVVAIVADGERVARASAGEDVSVVLDRTPFYPEGGGQVGDAGWLRGDDLQVDIEDTRGLWRRDCAHWQGGFGWDRGRRSRCRRRSVGRDARMRPGITRQRICFMQRCARCWATMCARRGRWLRPTTCVSITHSPRHRHRPTCAQSNNWSRSGSARTFRFRRPRCPTTTR